MVLFNCIEDKDLFHTFYTTRLCGCLINGMSAPHERNEVNVISKLHETGFEYTSELRGMSAGTIPT